MTDKLTRSLVVLEREAYDAAKTARASAGDAGKFWTAFGVDRGDRSENLEPGGLHKELSRALSTVEGARVEFGQQRSRLQPTGDAEGGEALPEVEPVSPAEGVRFSNGSKSGFAFSLR